MARPTHNILTILARLLAVASILLGTCLLISVAYEQHYARASLNWPGTPGELREYTNRVWKDCSGIRTGCRAVVVDERHVYYVYALAGQEYHGTRISFGQRERDAPDPDTGSKVTVYYNPSWPSQSVLLTGEAGVPWGLIVGGLVLIGLGSALPKLAARLTQSAHKH